MPTLEHLNESIRIHNELVDKLNSLGGNMEHFKLTSKNKFKGMSFEEVIQYLENNRIPPPSPSGHQRFTSLLTS